MSIYKTPSSASTRFIRKPSWLTMICLLSLTSIFMILPANSAKVYHCLQSNGTKAFQGRPCEENKKTIAVTEQKNRKKSSDNQESSLNIIGKWTLNGISSSPDGAIQTQEEKISWTFTAEGKVTYEYQGTSAVYDYTLEGEKINIPDSAVGSFEVIKNESDSAIWKTGTTYYFLTLSSVV